MDGITELAKLLKARDNPQIPSINIGIIISPLPNIEVSLGNKIILNKDHLYISSHIYNHYKNIDETYLNANDKVMLIPTSDEQMYYLVDKVEVI